MRDVEDPRFVLRLDDDVYNVQFHNDVDGDLRATGEFEIYGPDASKLLQKIKTL